MIQIDKQSLVIAALVGVIFLYASGCVPFLKAPDGCSFIEKTDPTRADYVVAFVCPTGKPALFVASPMLRYEAPKPKAEAAPAPVTPAPAATQSPAPVDAAKAASEKGPPAAPAKK